MKLIMKYILWIIFLLLPFSANAGIWLCVWPHYKIISYEFVDNVKTIKWWWIYDLFLNWPILESKNISFKGSYYIDSWSKTCEYENFEYLEELTFFKLTFKDKIKLIFNLLISLFWVITFLFLIIKYHRISLTVFLFILIAFSLFYYLYL